MRIVFFGSPHSAVPGLLGLIEDGHEVVTVITQPDRPAGRDLRITPPPVKQVALARALPILQPETLTAEDFFRRLRLIEADLGVVIAYGRILPPRVLEMPPRGSINLHFSLLPKYRGAAPVNWAIVRGESVTGVTTMQMDAGLDTGPILMQREAAIGENETAHELLARLSALGASLLSETIRALERNDLHPRNQDHTLASSAPLLKKIHGQIRWRDSAETIRNQIRGLQPWPCAWTRLDWQVVKLWGARASEDQCADVAPGTITSIRDGAIEVACGDGTRLRLFELQRENQRRISAIDFANGFRLHPGQQFHLEEHL